MYKKYFYIHREKQINANTHFPHSLGNKLNFYKVVADILILIALSYLVNCFSLSQISLTNDLQKTKKKNDFDIFYLGKIYNLENLYAFKGVQFNIFI